MSKNPNYKEEYEQALVKAKKKEEKNLSMKKNEKLAMSGRWYFSLTLEMENFDRIIELAEQYSVKPSELAEMWILQGLEKTDKG